MRGEVLQVILWDDGKVETLDGLGERVEELCGHTVTETLSRIALLMSVEVYYFLGTRNIGEVHGTDVNGITGREEPA